MKKISQGLILQFAQILEQNDKYEKENIQLRKKLEKKELNISELKATIKIESLKNKILTNIIETNTDIKIDDIFQYNDKSILIKNYENGNIPIVVENFMNDKEKIYTVNIKKNKKIGKTFRILRNTELIEEDQLKLKKKLKK
jgi:hypothetical protein